MGENAEARPSMSFSGSAKRYKEKMKKINVEGSPERAEYLNSTEGLIKATIKGIPAEISKGVDYITDKFGEILKPSSSTTRKPMRRYGRGKSKTATSTQQ